MFERFTPGARKVVLGAVHAVENTEAPTVVAEHLFRTLLDTSHAAGFTPAGHALERLGILPRRDAIEADLADGRRRGGLSEADSEALAGLGIDVGQVVSRVEQVHGEGALAGTRARGRRSFGWSHHRPFSREAKQVLVRALREAVERGDNHIGDEHILLALAGQPGLVGDVLATHGAGYADVRRALSQSDGSGR